jgi:CRISPR-associated endonuclease/helicase Cas3
MGSRCDDNNFSFQHQLKDLKAYFEEKLRDDGRRILEFAGVISKPHVYKGVASLIDHDQFPHSVQTLVDGLPLKAGLTIVESPTGSGIIVCMAPNCRRIGRLHHFCLAYAGNGKCYA